MATPDPHPSFSFSGSSDLKETVHTLKEEPFVLPSLITKRYFKFAWLLHEQRIIALMLFFLGFATIVVWVLVFKLDIKPTLVIRASASLKQEAIAFTGTPAVSYDQLAFFITAVLPRLYTVDETGYPFLLLLQGLVDPALLTITESGFVASATDIKSNHMTQTLTITAVSDVVADEKLGRAAAYVKGYVSVTLHHNEALFYPYRAQVLLAVNPVGLLNAYPFYVLKCEEKTGPKALDWDLVHDNKRFLDL